MSYVNNPFVRVASVSLALSAFFAGNALPAWAFPDKPIQIIVHTKPGGAVDLMARQVAQIASRYSPKALVVVNKPGGSGLLAMANVIAEKADGHTALAFATAFVAPVETTDIGFTLDDFHPIACLTLSPEALLTSPTGRLATFKDVLADLRKDPRKQLWVGPGSGSMDHLMAIKTWDAAGVPRNRWPKWIPYGGGGPAVAAVMGHHSDVYVGNPEDVLGRTENLRVAAISSTNRHPSFPKVPTFKEFGLPMENEVMWRGIAVKKGTPPAVIAWYEKVLAKVAKDKTWTNFVERTMVQPVFIKHEEFKKMVARDRDSSRKYLKMAGFPVRQKPRAAPFAALIFVGFLAALLVATRLALRVPLTGAVWVDLVSIAAAVLFIYMSTYFPLPRAGQTVGAASIPRVWAVFVILVAGWDLLEAFRRRLDPVRVQSGYVRLVLGLSLIMLIYSLALPYAGFMIATGFLLFGGIYAMGYRRHVSAFVVVGAVLGLMYFVFIQVLSVPLPAGVIF